MEIDAIRVFVRVAELGSFTRASEQLGLSKARASIRIQELEAELGCRLLLRSTRAVRLSEDGERLPMVNCASPGYLAKHGTPTALADLERHWMVGYSPLLGGAPPSFEYPDGKRFCELPMRSLITLPRCASPCAR